jgi:hypothetical protein
LIPMTDTAMLQYSDVEQAAARIAGAAHRTPVLTSRTADATRRQLFFKCENYQRMGAFKFRGAYNAIARFSEAQRAAGVLTFSSGNHAQAIALSAQPGRHPRHHHHAERRAGAEGAGDQGYGGEVIFYDRYKENREEIGAAWRGTRHDPDPALRPSGRDLRPGHGGHGTVRGDRRARCAAGAARRRRPAGRQRAGGERLSPGCKVIGVEPEAGNDGQQSLRKRRRSSTSACRRRSPTAPWTTHLGEAQFRGHPAPRRRHRHRQRRRSWSRP